MTDAVAPAAPKSAASPEAAAQAQPFSRAYTRYAMGLLLGIYIVNFLDRQVVNILAEPIKNDLGLADWQLGLMSGLAFALFYTVLGVPIARAAERHNRPIIIAASVGAWSAFTALCGAAQNFVQLVLARIGVGVGEAGCTPPAHSLIADYVPKEKRASALAFYSMGTPLGGLFGLILGGLIADAFGWRWAFLVAGLPGVVFALLAWLTLKEPRKQLAAHARQVQAAQVSLRETLQALAGKPTFWCIAFAAAIKAFIGYGHAPFTASFFLRNHGDDIAGLAASVGDVLGYELKSVGFLGIALGLMSGIGGTLGSWLGGLDRRQVRRPRPARLHGGPGPRLADHHPDLHRGGEHRPRAAGPGIAVLQRPLGHAVVRAGLRHGAEHRRAADARHHRRPAAVHHQPHRPGPRPARGGRALQLVRPGPGHGLGPGRALGADGLHRLRHPGLRALLDGSAHHRARHGELTAALRVRAGPP